MATPLAGLTVLDEHGGAVALDQLWRERPAVLAFVRHFGWLFCQQQVVQLHRAQADFVAAGARLAVIGNGGPSFIAGFRDKSGYDGELYTDPDRRCYQALGLRRGVFTAFNRRAARAAVGAYRDGYRQTRTRGDAWQQGGVFVIETGGEMVYAYPSEYAGDHPPIAAILAALQLAPHTG